jgi:hypothetical protein
MPRFALALLLVLLGIVPAAAADWVASKLRGTAQVEVEAVWQPLGRGDVVADGQLVRTGPESRLELTRGAEIIALGPQTQARIETEIAKSYTIIHQDFGTVEVEAEVREIEHLEVRNKFLSAVVKGTVFVVTADAEGAEVEVTQGLVAVKAVTSRHTTSVPAGNRAFVRNGADLGVAGSAPPAIFDAEGFELPGFAPAASSADLPADASAASPDLQLAEAGALAVAPPGGLLVTGLPTGGTVSAAPQSNIDIAAAGIGIAIGIAIGALALLARRFFA